MNVANKILSLHLLRIELLKLLEISVVSNTKCSFTSQISDTMLISIVKHLEKYNTLDR